MESQPKLGLWPQRWVEYAVFALIHNGRLLADHQISRTRFHNVMKKLPR